MKKTLLLGGVTAIIISLFIWSIFGVNKLFTFLMYVIPCVLIASAILSGALLSGDRLRANYHIEDAKDRNERNRLISRILLFVSPYVVIFFILYFIK